MRANRLKEIWASGKPAIGGWCSMPGSFSAELMANQGWDVVTIDTQHGVIGYSEMLQMLQAISTTATPARPRLPVSPARSCGRWTSVNLRDHLAR